MSISKRNAVWASVSICGVFLVLWLTPTPNRVADAAMPPATYRAFQNGGHVLICPDMLNQRSCPQKEGMLRQNVETGEVVRLAQRCAPWPKTRKRTEKTTCYVDQCVPPGRYRYGFARPLKCMGTGSRFYIDVVVREAFPGCKRSDEPLPERVKRAPWGKTPWVCTRMGCMGCATGGSNGSVWGLLLFSLFVTWRLCRRSTT
jgi:hypothetical protein